MTKRSAFLWSCQKLWVKTAFLRKEEFHPSLNINYDVLEGMNRKETEEYRDWIVKERQKMHEHTL